MTAATSPGEVAPGLLSLGPWLKQHRRLLDITQDELAQKSLCSLATIRKIETGDLLPSKQLAQQIATALNIAEGDHAAFVAFARAERTSLPPTAFSTQPVVTDRFVAPTEEPSARRYRVPAPLTPMIGREWEIQATCALLRRPVARLLTLTGPPGSGKTRLALAIAETLQHDFAGGALFVPLATTSDPELVASAIAQALGVRLNVALTQTDEIIDHLRRQPLLMVLDNFEQLISASPLLLELLMAAEGLKLIVTSRSLLRLYGEHEFPVPPLPLPNDPFPNNQVTPSPAELMLYPALELFVQRAQAVQPAFALNEENAAAILRICIWLEGLPLAIEMAAAQVKWNSPQNLVGQLTHRLAALNSGPRYLAPRQQTLRGAIEWSYNLLDADERRLFDTLAVFVGGFTQEAAAAIVTDARVVNGEQLGYRLQSLVDHSLLKHLAQRDVQEVAPRYEMLETIREYALERLTASGNITTTQHAHAAYFHQIAHTSNAQLATAHQNWWLDRLDEEHGNLRAALRWSLANHVTLGLELASDLGEFWYVRGNLSDGRSWLTNLIAAGDASTAPVARANALRSAGYLAFRQGDQLEAQPLLEEALAIYRALDDQPRIAATLHHLGIAAFHQNLYALAQTYYEQALLLYERVDQSSQRAVLLKDLGLVAKDRGELTQAMAYFEQSLALQRGTGNPYAIARCLTSMSVVAYWQGDYAQAIHLGTQSLAIQRQLGDALGVAYTLENVGMAHYNLGNFAVAAQQMEECLALFRTTGDKMGVVLALDNLGIFALAQGQPAQSIRFHQESLAVAWQIREKRRVAFCFEGLAAAAGQSERAVQLFAAAAALRQAINAPMLPSDRAEYEAFLDKLQTHLGSERFEEEWQTGEGRALEDAVAYALAIS